MYQQIFFFFFFAEFKLLMFHNNIVKITEKNEQAESVEKLPSSYLHNLHSFFTMELWEKVKIFDFIKTMTRIKLFVHR